MGPKVPLRVPFARVVVEGLRSDCRVRLYADGVLVTSKLEENAEYQLDLPLEKGTVAQAELVGEGSCVNVRLEEK